MDIFITNVEQTFHNGARMNFRCWNYFLWSTHSFKMKGDTVMSVIISATTRFAGKSGKGHGFLAKAELMLNESRKWEAQGDNASALEYAYRAGLRAAGAMVACSRIASRKRKSSNVWDQLRMIGPEGIQWADRFQKFSRTRSRVVNGMDPGVSIEVVHRLQLLVDEFIGYLLASEYSEQEAA
ncbi:SAV_6107 family HEPN domain-containing protein [Corynebacterium rouxii]|uniref:SAV_6107 family HEPN domain-containing protein n=1 Tax=Corynebacterium rouxii TaxID=2719119 RepID=UPI00313D0E97